MTAGTVVPNRSSRLPAFTSRPSADLAGRAVAIAADVPAVFDATLAAHHKMIGRWVAARETSAYRYTRQDARRRIEDVFSMAVAEILRPFNLVSLRVVALAGDSDVPPALTIVCDTIGQVELGWIEKSNVLMNTAFGAVAPVGWRAAAYQTICQTLGAALPVFGYEELFEEVSAYYWDGALDDEGARAALLDYGHGDDDIAEMTLPSQMAAKRPDWMTAKAAPLKHMPRALRAALKRVRDAHDALKAIGPAGNAWHCDREHLFTYLPEAEEWAHLPPITLVCADEFARELDDIGRFGMEMGFDDIAGLCSLTDADAIDAWFASLKVGAELLLATQALINLDPANPVKP